MASSIPLSALLNIDFDNTLGALFIGLLAATLLTGVVSVQTYIYFLNSGKRDRIYLRLLVLCLWALDAFEFVCAAAYAYRSLITNYLNPIGLLTVTWSVPAYIATGAVSNFLVRSMFIYRVFKLSGNQYLGAAMALGNCAVAAFGLVLAGKFNIITNFLERKGITWLISTSFGSVAFIDTLIAFILCWNLWRMRTGFNSRTDSQLDTLMHYSIHTGALTSLIAIITLILYLTMPNNLVYMGVWLPLPKFYHNALLATLNAREMLLGQTQGSTTAAQISRFEFASNPTEKSIEIRDLAPHAHDGPANGLDQGYKLPAQFV
ncbi:hypothetical protein C8Q75DRAFT_141122 [Abortiporus biennis]|nr:hypothetical protein C8Q75DRAFT_141122 [Abortiporus biennis]